MVYFEHIFIKSVHGFYFVMQTGSGLCRIFAYAILDRSRASIVIPFEACVCGSVIQGSARLQGVDALAVVVRLTRGPVEEAGSGAVWQRPGAGNLLQTQPPGGVGSEEARTGYRLILSGLSCAGGAGQSGSFRTHSYILFGISFIKGMIPCKMIKAEASGVDCKAQLEKFTFKY